MEKLSRGASGVRHLRWGLEVLASLEAHRAANYLLTTEQKDALAAEKKVVDLRVQALAAAVGPYRDFIEHAHVSIRAKQRVANFLCDEAQRTADGALRPHRREVDSIVSGGYAAIFSKLPLSRVLRVGHEKTAHLAESAAGVVRTLPAKIPGTSAIADGLEKASALLRDFIKQSDTLEAQRQPLRSAVNKAIYELREELDQMDGRLRSFFSADFIDSLYPELTRRGTAIADENDEDDDTSAPTET